MINIPMAIESWVWVSGRNLYSGTRDTYITILWRGGGLCWHVLFDKWRSIALKSEYLRYGEPDVSHCSSSVSFGQYVIWLKNVSVSNIEIKLLLAIRFSLIYRFFLKWCTFYFEQWNMNSLRWTLTTYRSHSDSHSQYHSFDRWSEAVAITVIDYCSTVSCPPYILLCVHCSYN